MSSVRRKLFKEGSNSWASETIGETQTNDEVENDSTELVEYTVVNEGDVTFKGQLVENPHGLKTPQENVFRRAASSFSEKVKMARLVNMYLILPTHKSTSLHVRFVRFQEIASKKIYCRVI